MSSLSERGQRLQEFYESSEGAVDKNFIVYAAQAIDPYSGDNYADPDGEYVIDEYDITVSGVGTIQFFREHVTTDVASEMTPVMYLDDINAPHTKRCIWRPGPLHDVYYKTTGDINVTVTLKTHVIRRGFQLGMDIDL